MLRKEECSKAGVERHGVEPIVNVRCHNFHNTLGRLFFWGGGGGGRCEYGGYLSAFYCSFISAGKDTVYLT